MGRDIVQIRNWWMNRRVQFNKALLFSGLMGFLAQALVYPFRWQYSMISGLPSNMELSATCLIIYLAMANTAFTLGSITLGSILDFVFNPEDCSSFREWVFIIGYYFAIVVLIFLMIVFLYII